MKNLGLTKGEGDEEEDEKEDDHEANEEEEEEEPEEEEKDGEVRDFLGVSRGKIELKRVGLEEALEVECEEEK